MGFAVNISQVNYSLGKHKRILDSINETIEAGMFVALLGENGAGKTTLLDLLMGFRKSTSGEISIDGQNPVLDPWEMRQDIAYLSEKVDIPGDWSVEEYLQFNRFFYNDYSIEMEKHLIAELKIDIKNRLGNMSAGEVRRAQVVGALSIKPRLILVDEITAVLDIIGRRKFMRMLADQNKENGCTVILATNILEDLENYASHIFLIRNGQKLLFKSMQEFLGTKEKYEFSQLVADHLE